MDTPAPGRAASTAGGVAPPSRMTAASLIVAASGISDTHVPAPPEITQRYPAPHWAAVVQAVPQAPVDSQTGPLWLEPAHCVLAVQVPHAPLAKQ
jgi:hypothetical protein